MFSSKMIKITKLSKYFHINSNNSQWLSLVTNTMRFSTSNILKDRYYTDKHEWIDVKDKIGTVGISHYAQEALGDVVYAELPAIGTEVKIKDECGALESVKAASELYSPASGKIVEINSKIETSPALINQSCYENGWLFKLELSSIEEVQNLMNEEQYTEFIKQDHN
ncbi:Glycine cleavage system H-protein/Simiate,Glycine cleavage system H-protein [Cinara cedri]|uniref:Glycine cleavage system H protein n=1 Tax=Cinara cedri TaxID=506608 RepID=A0A5E4NPN9_9HEMI|nr:Glycine cleavage system H-protein/Simiate,Glycine cleavage system H-protein [Cinara cedri]